MRHRNSRLIFIWVAYGLLCSGCGGESGSPSQPPGEPFVAKGKLKSEMEANTKLQKFGKAAPAR